MGKNLKGKRTPTIQHHEASKVNVSFQYIAIVFAFSMWNAIRWNSKITILGRRSSNLPFLIRYSLRATVIMVQFITKAQIVNVNVIPFVSIFLYDFWTFHLIRVMKAQRQFHTENNEQRVVKSEYKGTLIDFLKINDTFQKCFFRFLYIQVLHF